MNIESNDWRPDNPVWLKQRQKDWEELGLPFVSGLLKGDDFFKPEDADQLKNYFFTGAVAAGYHLPFYFKIKFYPGDSEAFIVRCFEEASDRDLGCYFGRFSWLAQFGKHNASFANQMFSESITSRLETLDKRLRRDTLFIETLTLTWVRKLKCINECEAPNFYHTLDDRYFPFVLGEGNRLLPGIAQSSVKRLIEALVYYLDREVLPGEESEQKKFYLELSDRLNRALPEQHRFREYWQKVSQFNAELPNSRWDDEEELAVRPALSVYLSDSTENFEGAIQQFVHFMDEYGFSSETNKLEQFTPVDLHCLVSPEAKTEFQLPQGSMLGFHSSLLIDHPLLKSSVLEGELFLHFLVIPNELNADGYFHKARVLLAVKNSEALLDKDIPDYLVELYHAILRWCREKSNVDFFTVKNAPESDCFSGGVVSKGRDKVRIAYRDYALFRPEVNFLKWPECSIENLKRADVKPLQIGG